MGLKAPMVIRMQDTLRHRVTLLNQAFAKAIKEEDYKGEYRGVFPIKVNQQRHLIEEVVESGRPYRYGLEAGSKPELLIALAAMDDEDGFIICNGYKDRGYIETALVAQRFDNTVVVVLERIEELDIVFRAFEDLGIRPTLGVRAKLSSKGMGRWSSSAGDKAKFGLTTAEMVEVVDRLAERDMLDCLRLLHFHIGSQLCDIRATKEAVKEATRLFCHLKRRAPSLRVLDVGGGLAVDYDGSKTDFRASMNYGVQEYAYDVVAAVQDACEKAGVAHPTIVSESGRAVAAHQSVLVFDALGVDHLGFGKPEEPPEGCHRVIREMYDTWLGIQPKNVQEAWHDAQTALEESRSLFKFGYLGLRELARAERLFWNCAEKIRGCVNRLKQVPEELQQLDEFLGSI